MAFPNPVYLSSKIHFVCFRGQNVDLADLGGKNFPNSQQSGKNSRVSCPNSAQSRFPKSSQFPNPVKIFCVFPDPALYFSQIPDPENTPPDPHITPVWPGKRLISFIFHLLFCLQSATCLQAIMCHILHQSLLAYSVCFQITSNSVMKLLSRWRGS